MTPNEIVLVSTVAFYIVALYIFKYNVYIPVVRDLFDSDRHDDDYKMGLLMAYVFSPALLALGLVVGAVCLLYLIIKPVERNDSR